MSALGRCSTLFAVSAIVISLLGMRLYTFLGLRYPRPMISIRSQDYDATMDGNSAHCNTLTVEEDLQHLTDGALRPGHKAEARFGAMEDAVFINEDWAILSNFEQEHLIRRSHYHPDAVPMYYPLIGLHLPSQKLFELPLHGFPADIAFRPHGLDVSRTSEISGVLLVVNHALTCGGERVEHLVYDIEDSNVNDHGELFRLPQLRYVQSITHPQLGDGAMNDVAIATVQPLRFFITRWKAMDINFNRWVSGIEKITDFLVMLLNLPATYIVYCSEHPTEADDGKVSSFSCAVPKGQYYAGMYNGITLSSNKKRLIVADLGAKAIAVYQIIPPRPEIATGTPELKKLRTVFTPHLLDNLVLDERLSGPTLDVINAAGLYAFKFVPSALSKFEKYGYEKFRDPYEPNDLYAPNQLPSSMMTVRIQYEQDGCTVDRKETKVQVDHVSSDGAWSVAAVNPFNRQSKSSCDITSRTDDDIEPSQCISESIEANGGKGSRGRTLVIGSFTERYLILCND